MLTRPKVVPFRWPDFGLDLRAIVLDSGDLLFFASDVCEALDIDVPVEFDGAWPEPGKTYIYPGTTSRVVTAGGYAENDTDDVYTSAEVRRLALDNPEWFTAQFLDWLYELEHPAGGTVNVALFRQEEPALAEIAAGRTYSVGRAARLLARDPAIKTIGQQSLFAAMQEHGWISRDKEIWVPNDHQLRNGNLVRQRQRVQGRKELYPQVRITRDGLKALHSLLGGMAALALDDGPDLTLVDL